MRYFRPDLLARCRSRDDDVADAAAAEWDKAAVAYQRRLDEIRTRLPGGAVDLTSRYALHDAKVLVFAVARDAFFGLVLQQDGVPGAAREALELAYRPAVGEHGGVIVTTHEGRVGEQAAWVLYDEFDHDETHGFFTHNLLLSDGREVEVRFTDLTVRVLDEIIPPAHLTKGERKWRVPEAVA